jgi:pimeloyl-ACP methyl ester carboxylesterase
MALADVWSMPPITSAAAIEASHPPRGVMVPVPGGRLHLIDRRPAGREGGRWPVVLLHGASGNACDMSLDLFAALAREHRVIAVDRPGHGWSDRPGGGADADPARQARLILAGLRRIGALPCILVAHSWSGGLALSAALDHPDDVAGVVLVGAATHPWPGGRISWYHALGAHPRLGNRFCAIAPAGRLLLASGLASAFRPQTPPQDFAERTALPLLFRPAQFRANAEDMAGLHAFLTAQQGRYGTLARPVETIVSDADKIVPMAHGEALASQSRRVRLTVLHGYGHMLQHVAVPAIVDAVGRIGDRIRREDPVAAMAVV